MSNPAIFSTRVHPFESPTPHACAYELGQPDASDAFVFIGGLGDGPHTVPYPRAIAKLLGSQADLSYSVFEFRLTSAFKGFGFASLADDAADIAAVVRYLRSIGKRRIVLMGHSTGTQDILEYTAPAHSSPPVEGYILQAPACDQGALIMDMGQEALEAALRAAKALIEAGRGHERLPLEHTPAAFQDVPLSAERFYALGATDGADNYFDPSHPDEVAKGFWQRVDKPILILHSGQDEYVPSSVDKEALVQHWKTLCRPGIVSDLSGTIPGADHRVEKREAEAWLAETVVKFLRDLQKEV